MQRQPGQNINDNNHDNCTITKTKTLPWYSITNDNFNVSKTTANKANGDHLDQSSHLSSLLTVPSAVKTKKITHRSFDFVDRYAREIAFYSERMKDYRQMQYNFTCYREQCPESKLCPKEVGCLLCCCTFTVVSCFSQRLNSFFVKICSNWPNQDLVLTCSILPRRVPGQKQIIPLCDYFTCGDGLIRYFDLMRSNFAFFQIPSIQNTFHDKIL